MRKIFNIRITGLFLALALLLVDCNKVPVTGRRQFDILPDGQVLALANDQYNQFLNQSKVVTGTDEERLVKKVGNDIAAAVERYFSEQGDKDQLKGYNWEFNLVQDPAINAFAMPGGKTVVYTGILPIAETEAGLAVIMGHEIAHAIAKHGDERMSQALTAQLGGAALSVALRNKPQQTRQLFLASYGLGSQVGILLPFSRTQESEADKLGLVFMAMAGYNPHAAIDFWQRMGAVAQGPGQPEFLSTHPHPETRVENIRQYMDEAMKYYRPELSKE